MLQTIRAHQAPRRTSATAVACSSSRGAAHHDGGVAARQQRAGPCGCVLHVQSGRYLTSSPATSRGCFCTARLRETASHDAAAGRGGGVRVTHEHGAHRGWLAVAAVARRHGGGGLTPAQPHPARTSTAKRWCQNARHVCVDK